MEGGGQESGVEYAQQNRHTSYYSALPKVHPAARVRAHPGEDMQVPQVARRKWAIPKSERTWVVHQKVNDNGEGVELTEE